MILQRLHYAKNFFKRGHVQVETHVIFHMSSPLKEHRLACILQKATVRIPTATTPTYEFHLLLVSVELSESMATAKKVPLVKSDMFMNALTSAIQVNVPQKGASYPIDTKQASCESMWRKKAVMSLVMKMMRKSIATTSIPTT